MRARPFHSTAFALLLCALSAPAFAQELEYTFTGIITDVNGPTGVFSTVQVGDPFTVVVVIDTLATGTDQTVLADYLDATLSASIDIGGVVSSPALVPSSNPGVSVTDNIGNLFAMTCSDGINVRGSAASDYSSFVVILDREFPPLMGCPTVWSDVDIPLSLNVSDFDTRRFLLRTSPGLPEIEGDILNVSEVATCLNDDCVDAVALPSAFADTPYNATGATTDGADSTGFCDYGAFGDEQNNRDVWFTYTPDVGGCTYISTFGLAGYDTRLTIYRGYNCPDDPADILACADEESLPASSPLEAGFDVDLEAGVTYTIRLGTFSNFEDPGAGVLRIAAGPGADVNSGGNNPGAPGCDAFLSYCSGDGGNQMGCTDCPCFNNAPVGTIGGCLNSAGTGARLIGSGDPSVSLPPNSLLDLRFSISGAPPIAFCILNSGAALAPGNVASPCFGLNTGGPNAVFDGLRCAITDTRRHGGRTSDFNGDVGILNIPWGGEGGPPVGLAVAGSGYAAGQTRFFQVINRDNPALSCMRGLNTSQALKVTFQP